MSFEDQARNRGPGGSERTVSILDLLIILLERKRLILFTMAIVSVASVVISSLLPKHYTATAVILPSIQTSPFTGVLGSIVGDLPMGGLLQSISGLGSKDNDQILSILESRRLADRVIERFDLKHRYKFHKQKKWYYETLQRAYFRNLEVDESDLGTISIAFTDTSPAFAAEVVNYIVGQLDTITYELSQTAARNSRLFFESRLAAIKRDMDSAHNAFNRFRLAHGYLDLDRQLPASVTALAELEAQRMALDVQIEQLRSRFGDDNRAIGELVRSRAALSRRIDGYMKEGAGRLIIALDSAPELGVEYAHLLRNVKVQETLFNLVTQMYEQARFVEVNNTPVVRVLEYAPVPQKKRRPKRAILCTLWFFFAGTGVCTYVLLTKWYRVQRESNSDVYRRLRAIRGLLMRWR